MSDIRVKASWINKIDAEITRLRSELAAVTTERDRMREALKPFVRRLEVLEETIVHKYAIGTDIDVIHLRAARAALEGVTEPASPWRDIESAPKDGTHFLVWDKHYGIRIGKAYVRHDHDDWLSYMDARKGSSKGGLRATHWMPLPEPPR